MALGRANLVFLAASEVRRNVDCSRMGEPAQQMGTLTLFMFRYCRFGTYIVTMLRGAAVRLVRLRRLAVSVRVGLLGLLGLLVVGLAGVSTIGRLLLVMHRSVRSNKLRVSVPSRNQINKHTGTVAGDKTAAVGDNPARPSTADNKTSLKLLGGVQQGGNEFSR